MEETAHENPRNESIPTNCASLYPYHGISHKKLELESRTTIDS